MSRQVMALFTLSIKSYYQNKRTSSAYRIRTLQYIQLILYKIDMSRFNTKTTFYVNSNKSSKRDYDTSLFYYY